VCCACWCQLKLAARAASGRGAVVLVGNLHYPLGKCKKIHIVYN
jgi:hypothetical protein